MTTGDRPALEARGGQLQLSGTCTGGPAIAKESGHRSYCYLSAVCLGQDTLLLSLNPSIYTRERCLPGPVSQQALWTSSPSLVLPGHRQTADMQETLFLLQNSRSGFCFLVPHACMHRPAAPAVCVIPGLSFVAAGGKKISGLTSSPDWSEGGEKNVSSQGLGVDHKGPTPSRAGPV